MRREKKVTTPNASLRPHLAEGIPEQRGLEGVQERGQEGAGHRRGDAPHTMPLARKRLDDGGKKILSLIR